MPPRESRREYANATAKKPENTRKDTRLSAEVGSYGCLSPQDERDLAFMCNPGIYPSYTAGAAWWTVTLEVKRSTGRPTKHDGKGRTFASALSNALAQWRRDQR